MSSAGWQEAARLVLRDNYRTAENLTARAAALREGVLYTAARGLPEGSLLTVDAIAGLFADLTGEAVLAEDFPRFCQLTAARCPSPFPAESEAASAPLAVACVRSGDLDLALDGLQTGNRIPRRLFSSTAEICEEVSEERCRYCLLPVYAAGDGALLYFRKLIHRYDLKITAACEVADGEDGAALHYALLQHEPLSFAVRRHYLEIMLPADSRCGVPAFLRAAEQLGFPLLRSGMIPSESRMTEGAFLLTLDAGDADPAPLLLYLVAACPGGEPVGYYDLSRRERPAGNSL